MRTLAALDQRLDRLSPSVILGLAACGLALIGGIDYLTGYEVSMSVVYLGPVALAAWYAGRRMGVAVAVVSCVTWYIAEVATGHSYSYWAIPIWNALVRFGFFLITSLLLTALRASLLNQRHLARRDGLTDLYSRRAFEDRLEHDLALARRRKSALTLVYLDLDNFKDVNDTHGHTEGDRVLRTVGRVLQSSIRQADTAARLGGDEFALVLPDTDGAAAQQVIANLARELQETFASSKVEVTASIGVVTFLDPGFSVAQAVAAADGLMYEVKRGGKDGVAFSVLSGAVQPHAAAAAALHRRQDACVRGPSR